MVLQVSVAEGLGKVEVVEEQLQSRPQDGSEEGPRKSRRRKLKLNAYGRKPPNKHHNSHLGQWRSQVAY